MRMNAGQIATKRQRIAEIERLVSAPSTKLENIPLDLIDPSVFQARKTFDEVELSRLAASLATQGLVQPIVVRATKEGRYQIVVGERRWRAAQIAGWKELPAHVRYLSDVAAAAMVLAENELRVQVGRIETARAAQAMIDRFGYTHEELGVVLGMDRASVTNLLRLLTLETSVLTRIGDGPEQLSAGHAKVLVGMPRAQQRTLADRVIREGLSVRALERLKDRLEESVIARDERAQQKRQADPRIALLQQHLTELFHQPVAVDWPLMFAPHRSAKRKGGSVTIQFGSFEEVEKFLERIHAPIATWKA
jgi:ParB family transcriptional regulator, chromosome partitioning protein